MTMKYYIYDGGYFERDVSQIPVGAVETTQRPAIYYTWNGSSWVFDQTMASAYWQPIVESELQRTTKFMLPDQSSQTIADATSYRASLLTLVSNAEQGQSMPSVPSNLTETAYFGLVP